MHDISRRPDKKNFNIFMKSLEVYKKIIEQLKLRSKHVSCPHPYSCAHYILKVCILINKCQAKELCICSNAQTNLCCFYLQGGMEVFSYALSAQLVINLFFQIKKLFIKPQLLKSIIFKRNNLNLAVFLGGFTGLYRVLLCSSL